MRGGFKSLNRACVGREMEFKSLNRACVRREMEFKNFSGAQPWWPGLADKSFLLDHDDTGAALGLHQIPDLLAIVVQRWDEERIIFRVVILLRA